MMMKKMLGVFGVEVVNVGICDGRMFENEGKRSAHED
jgi:hypothetical protein